MTAVLTFRHHQNRRQTVLGLLLILFWSCQLAAEPLLIDQGKAIYENGLLPSGQPLKGRTQGDIEVSGEQFSCIGCHRRSGYGTTEGGNYVVPITAPILYSARKLDRAERLKKLYKEIQPRRFWARMRTPHVRPAYSDETLARAIRDGVDAAGNALDPLMPRYQMSDDEIAALIAYLKTVSTESDPGVDKKTIYFATIVTKGGDRKKRQAVVDVIQAFVQWNNLDIKGDLSKPNFSPMYRSEQLKAYRTWQMDVWQLGDDPTQWVKELQAYYDNQPVFAVISGLVEAPWDPVGQFCEQNRLPCLFPNNELPSLAAQNYSLFFNRGVALEGSVAARYLQQQSGVKKTVQLHSKKPGGRVPAEAFTAAFNSAMVDTYPFAGEKALQSRFAQLLSNQPPVDQLIIWPADQIAATWQQLIDNPTVAKRIILPSAALEQQPVTLPAALKERLYFVYPYELPSAYHPRTFRVRGWMRSRRLTLNYPRLQMNTYYALTTVQYGLDHIVDQFSRDYLLEFIEHEAENSLNPGTFPRLSLGPGQRFASKGAYVVQIKADSDEIEPSSEWIVP